MIESPGLMGFTDYLIDGFAFTGSLLTVALVGVIFRYLLGKGLKHEPDDPVHAEVLSRRIRQGGILLVIAVAGVVSLLYTLAPSIHATAWWSFCGMGAATACLAWLRFRHTAWKALPPSEPLAGVAAADCFMILYAFCLLSFTLLMAMGVFVKQAIPDWSRMTTGTMEFGLAAAFIFVMTSMLLPGKKVRGALVILVSLLWLVPVYWLVRCGMQCLPTQSLIDTGIMDRRGPFWAVAVALIELPFVRFLALRYAKGDDSESGDSESGRAVYLFGEFEKPVMLLLFPFLFQWMVWQLAGCYGLGLSATVVAVSLAMWLPFDLDSVTVHPEAGQTKGLKTALHGTLLLACFAVMTSALALVALNF